VIGRITTHLDRGLGWTKPVVVACCGTCGTELARNTNQAKAERAARRRRCPDCGTRSARRLAGTTSLATDLELVAGWRALAAPRRWPHDLQPASRVRRAGRR
jgi:DNA-directed RNA polymerase subunit RPC12/RpoP